MKKLNFLFTGILTLMFGCQQIEFISPEETQVEMQKITISADMGSIDTKASVDTETGEFKWQSGDVISVLATDDKFYTFTLESGDETKYAEFTGSLPEGVTITSVATYPAIAANGTQNTFWSDNTLNYVLPSSWTWKKDVSNVPMVAIFEEGATEMAFKQVGGVMRFPITNMPREATLIFTMPDKTITGEFPLNLVIPGEAAMVAGTTASQVIINYSSDTDGQDVEFNLPVPTGTYNKFTLEIKANDGTQIYTKSYKKDNVVERATLLNMKKIKLNAADLGIGTEPDDTDYDVYKLGEVPISFWWAPPTWFHNYDDTKTREAYKLMADSGINVVNYDGEVDKSLEENVRIMNIAGELGMKFIGQTRNAAGASVEYTTAERIAAIKEHLAPSPYYVAEYLIDEPGASKFDMYGEFTKEFFKEIPDKDIYINLFPDYARQEQLGCTTYEQYINEYMEKIPSKMISYDHYALNGNGTLGSSYYTNLDLVRSKTHAVRKPFWVITQTGKVDGNAFPTYEQERWTVWSSLALGSKGIAYFCYWDPAQDGNGTTSMINRFDGTPREQYYWIQKINQDISTISKKLLYCHADGAISSSTRYYPLYDNGKAGRTKYGPVRKVSAKSEHVVCGCFRDARISENGDNYKGYKVLIVSHQHNKPLIKTGLTLDPSVTRITVTQNNTTEVVELTNLTDFTMPLEKGINMKYSGNEILLEIPQGEALLIEF